MTTSTAFAQSAPRPAALLRRTLAANAIFSAASGLAMIVLSGPLDRFMGLGLSWLLIVVGVGLLGFAVLMGLNLRRPQLNRAEAWLTVASDVSWVAASAIILIGFPDLLSTGGKWLVGLVAVAVADFALFQYLGLRQAREQQASMPRAAFERYAIAARETS